MPDNENIFFINLEKVLGNRFVKSKRLNRPITNFDVFLDKNHTKFNFPQEINDIFISILKSLLSTETIPFGSLSHKIDGLIINHPNYGNRIVEFDEEQHFNPFKRETLSYLSKTIIHKKLHIQHCNDIACYHRMLCKMRIKYFPKRIPKSTSEFQAFIEKNKTLNNGYIKKVKGFNFWGGRIAQRAYYDILRDYAHLSERNVGFFSSIRFSLFEIENKYSKIFESITDKEIQEYISCKLVKFS